MTTKKKIPTAQPLPKQEFSKSPDFKTIYANWVQATFSPHEVSMIVGESFQIRPQVMGIEHRARVVFSPLEAKLLSVILGKVVESFEAQFGRVVVPHIIGDQLVDQIPAMKELMAPKTEDD